VCAATNDAKRCATASLQYGVFVITHPTTRSTSTDLISTAYHTYAHQLLVSAATVAATHTSIRESGILVPVNNKTYFPHQVQKSRKQPLATTLNTLRSQKTLPKSSVLFNSLLTVDGSRRLNDKRAVQHTQYQHMI
jgi:hypothetical protein